MIRTMIGAVVVLGATALAAGCSSASTSSGQQMSGGASRSCGTTRTGANVPVIINVAKGHVDCRTAMKVERDYAAEIKNGDLKGNGGGAPLNVDGWTCQGYPTPEVLRTGDASVCQEDGTKILAELDVPSSSSTG